MHLLGTAIEEGRDRSSMSGILADTARRLRPVPRAFTSGAERRTGSVAHLQPRTSGSPTRYSAAFRGGPDVAWRARSPQSTWLCGSSVTDTDVNLPVILVVPGRRRQRRWRESWPSTAPIGSSPCQEPPIGHRRLARVSTLQRTRIQQAKERDAMTKVAQAVMAVVHVQAPAQVDPHAIEAELVRALNTYRKRPMSAEFTLAPDHRSRSLGGRRRHGFVGILSFAACAPPADLQRRVQKRARKALRHRFGQQVSAAVETDITTAEINAYWSVVRGTPRRWP